MTISEVSIQICRREPRRNINYWTTQSAGFYSESDGKYIFSSSSPFASSFIRLSSRGLSSLLQKSSYSCLSPPFFFTSTTTKSGVSSKISAAIVNGPFTPSLEPSRLTL